MATKPLRCYPLVSSLDRSASLRSDQLLNDSLSPAPLSSQISTHKVVYNKSGSNGAVGIEHATFNPLAEEFMRTWHSNSSDIFCVNAYPNGVTLSAHEGTCAWDPDVTSAGQYEPNQFHLRFSDTKDYLLAEGKHYLFKENYRQHLEQRFSQLHEQGKLKSAVVYFGTTGDPFLSFQKKFDVTMNCLSLFEQYRPGLLVLQTRSPLVISALPTLKLLERKAVVAIPIETRLESAICRYTPGQPKISERLVAATGLRRQGITVNLMASPILPYGEVQQGAWDFADLLDSHADFITFGCLACGKPDDEAKLKNLPVARKLVTDKQYRWLRPYCYRSLYFALKVLCPEKLLLPVSSTNAPAQLDMFAA